MQTDEERQLAHPGSATSEVGLQGLPGNNLFILFSAMVVLALSACTTQPLILHTEETSPLILVPVSEAGVRDKRARFREVFCEVLEQRRNVISDYQPCEDALAQVGVEPAGKGMSVDMGPSRRRLVAAIVPGIGWDCFETWLNIKDSGAEHVRQFGYDLIALKVDGLSSSANNARQIRDAIMQMASTDREPRLVLIGYSKGISDILEAVVAYPEIRQQIAAVVSAAGAVGGTPLANMVDPSQLAPFRNWPGAQCAPGDGGAIQSLRTGTRKAWLAQNSLPSDFPYYSVVAFPKPERISAVLKPSYNILSRVDARNDSQVLFYDQVVPGSILIGYINADHWALTLPIARSHEFLGATLVNHNDFPREALLEALLRFIEEDLEALADR